MRSNNILHPIKAMSQTDSFWSKPLREKAKVQHVKGFMLLIEGLNTEKEASGIFSSWGGVLNETLYRRGVDGALTIGSYILCCLSL